MVAGFLANKKREKEHSWPWCCSCCRRRDSNSNGKGTATVMPIEESGDPKECQQPCFVTEIEQLAQSQDKFEFTVEETSQADRKIVSRLKSGLLGSFAFVHGRAFAVRNSLFTLADVCTQCAAIFFCYAPVGYSYDAICYGGCFGLSAKNSMVGNILCSQLAHGSFRVHYCASQLWSHVEFTVELRGNNFAHESRSCCCTQFGHHLFGIYRLCL